MNPRVIFAIIFLGTIVNAWRPWIYKAHRACLAGNLHYKVRKGWRVRCEFNMKPEKAKASKLPLYIISGVTNCLSSKRSHIYFGPILPNGHPQSFHFDTHMDAEEAMSVFYPIGDSVFIEATDFGMNYYIRIKTPNHYNAACYNLVSNKSPNITLVRDASCLK